ncbi:MAG: hypothetical protein WCF04_08120 [Candidatus Nanopelagicales bacterium]
MGSVLDRVEERLGEVGERLTATTGGQALCRLDGHMSSAKDLEGRMAVLLEIRRALRKDPDAVLTGIEQRWRHDLESRRARGASQAWISYLSGGVAEIEALLG